MFLKLKFYSSFWECLFWFPASVKHTKDKLISKCLLGVCNFSQKTNENKSTWGIIVVKLHFFDGFLGELRIPKNPFKINWSLVCPWFAQTFWSSWAQEANLEQTQGILRFFTEAVNENELFKRSWLKTLHQKHVTRYVVVYYLSRRITN